MVRWCAGAVGAKQPLETDARYPSPSKELLLSPFLVLCRKKTHNGSGEGIAVSAWSLHGHRSSGCVKDQGTCINCDWHSDCKCVLKTCPAFMTPPNSTIADGRWEPNRKFNHQEEIVVTCLPGFQLVGSSNRSKSFRVKCGIDNRMDFPDCEP